MTIDTIIYFLLAVFVAWIWVDYFRMIDIYHKLTLLPIALTFVLGCLSVMLVFPIDIYVFSPLGFDLNDTFFNDFMYSWIGIGLVEEVAKLVPFLIMLYLFRQKFAEPIDYIIFASVSALGFSAIENVLYFHEYNSVFTMELRSLVASVGHMADTTIAAYGFVLYRFRKERFGAWIIPVMIGLAALSHGIYDFWLIYSEAVAWNGQFISFFYFLITISIFATMLNNAMNNSDHFDYSKVVRSSKVSNRLFLYYGIFILSAAGLAAYREQYDELLFLIVPYNIFFVGFLLAVICLRLSRFTLIQGRWNPIRIQLPFTMHPGAMFVKFQIRGEGDSDVRLCEYYHKFMTISPLIPRRSVIKHKRLAYLEDKVFLKNDQAFYLIRLYDGLIPGNFEHHLLVSKKKGLNTMQSGNPVSGLLRIKGPDDLTNINLDRKDFDFVEWVHLGESLTTPPSPQSQEQSLLPEGF